MKRLDLARLPAFVEQTRQEHEKSSITPRPQDTHREYYALSGAFTTLNQMSVDLRAKLSSELSIKNAELSKCTDGTFDHMKTTVSNYQEQLQGIVECLKLDLAKLDVFCSAMGSIDPETANIFIETYGNGSTSVTRYGIDVLSAQSYISKCNMPALPQPATKGAKGSNKSAKSDQGHKDENVVKTLHPIEIAIIQQALHSAESTILVDIFERNDDGSIARSAKDIPTHTIVLHKQKGQVLLIDPTNSEYSQHLSLGINKLLLGTNLLAPDKKLEIYSPKQDATGRDGDQTRDCTDVATKIRLQLKMPDTPPLEVTQAENPIEMWKAWLPLVSISNRGIDKDLRGNLTAPFEGDKPVVTLRIKQSSNDAIRSKFMDLNSKIQNLFDISKQLKGVEANTKDIKDEYIQLLSAPNNHEQYQLLLTDQGLVRIYDSLCQHVTELLGKQHTDLHAHIESPM